MSRQQEFDTVCAENFVSTQTGISHRWLTMSRVAAAVGGGYGLMTTSSLLLARILPLAPVDAVMTAMMLSFAIYATVILWVFAARSVARAWLMLSVATPACGLLAWFMGEVGA